MTKGQSAIITEDPTCDAWNRIADAVVAIRNKAVNGVIGINRYRRPRGRLDQRAMYEAVGQGDDAALPDQIVSLG